MFCTAFIGWMFFIVFSGIGFVSLPWDLILDYTYRPKPIDEGNFEEHKSLLLQYSLKLRDEGKLLAEDRFYVNTIRGIEGFQ
jgi:LMBR1 domain-containing protein 1